jgi:large subunit ribosomal protein L7/L12
MSDITKDQVIDWLSEQSVLEIADIVKTLEEKWGVSAAAPVAVAAAPAAGAGGGEAAAEKDEFDVILTSAGDKKINVIKEVRGITGLGLKEAAAKDEAEEIKKKLEAAGASVELK